MLRNIWYLIGCVSSYQLFPNAFYSAVNLYLANVFMLIDICFMIHRHAVLGNFVSALNRFIADRYSLNHSVSEYHVYEFFKVYHILAFKWVLCQWASKMFFKGELWFSHSTSNVYKHCLKISMAVAAFMYLNFSCLMYDVTLLEEKFQFFSLVLCSCIFFSCFITSY